MRGSETIRDVPIEALTAYAHVADVQRSVDFYRLLGLEVQSRHESEGQLVWALVARAGTPGDGDAKLMLARASGPVDAGSQAVLFYCWTADVVALHLELAAASVEVGELTHPFYMPAGEFRVEDPDGYVLLVGQLEKGD
jgi:catechol 2,3-dioxygenase-like lactoylglutathione lyase family enzyme